MAILGQQNPNTYRTDNLFTASSGQTTFSCHYNPMTVDVYQNGAKLAPVIDFTANNGVSVVLKAPALAGDVIEIIAHKVNLHAIEFSCAPIPVSVDSNLIHGHQYILEASCTLTLPPNPVANWAVRVFNNSGTMTATINRNGSLIHGLSENLQIDILDGTLTLIYLNSTVGWWVVF